MRTPTTTASPRIHKANAVGRYKYDPLPPASEDIAQSARGCLCLAKQTIPEPANCRNMLKLDFDLVAYYGNV
jgi:hypothetical protein